MKMKVLGLAALLFAGAASGAFAQERHGRGGGDGGGWRGGGGGWQGGAPSAPQAQPAPQPQPAPSAPQAQEWRRGGGGGGGWRPQEGGRFSGGRRPDAGVPVGGGDAGAAPQGGERRQWRGGEARPDTGAQPDGGRRDWGRGDGARQDWNRDGGQRRDWNGGDAGRRDWNRDNGQQRDWNRGDRSRRDDRRWDSRSYPRSYRSEQRFRAPAWRAPRGYYARSWRYGEILPFGWYGQDYWLTSWWDYRLPEPPPGLHWVRVGDDALLVDDFDGRIVQVVEDIFW